MCNFGYSPTMTREKSLFDTHDPASEAAADARAEADFIAGRVISHGAVKRWLGTWGKAQAGPRPHPGD
jgi:predicted transcriptional regulator